MNRRDFLKFASSVAAVAAAPVAIAQNIGHGTWCVPASNVGSALQQVNDRRIMLEIHKRLQDAYMNLYDAVEWRRVDAITCGCYRAAMTDVLEEFRAKCLIYDFNVVCDDANNPPSVVASGIVQVSIAWKPIIGINLITLEIGPSDAAASGLN